MAAPIEFRQYLRLYTLDDARRGLQPIRLPQGPQGVTELFSGPVLQYRYRERINVNGDLAMRWSDWIEVPIVREGDDAELLRSIDAPPELRPS